MPMKLSTRQIKPGIVLLEIVGAYFAPDAVFPHFAAGALLSGIAMIAVWQLPAAVRSREEQSSLARLALIDGSVDE